MRPFRPQPSRPSSTRFFVLLALLVGQLPENADITLQGLIRKIK